MRLALVLLVLGAILALPASASAKIRLTYFSSAESRSGKYAQDGYSEIDQGRAEYDLRARVTLRKRPRVGWVGRGKLVWTAAEYEGEISSCDDQTRPVRETDLRPGAFRVTRGKLRFGRGGRVRSARLTVSPGFPGMKVEAPAGCRPSEQPGWQDRQWVNGSPFPRGHGDNAGWTWRGLFDIFHASDCGGQRCEEPVYARCPNGRPDAIGDRYCVAKPYELPTISRWRRTRRGLAKSLRGALPRPDRAFANVRASHTETWKLTGRR